MKWKVQLRFQGAIKVEAPSLEWCPGSPVISESVPSSAPWKWGFPKMGLAH